MPKTYEGWKNHQTWNVALWITNNHGLYSAAVDFMKRYKGRTPYKHFIDRMGLNGQRTDDNIAWDGKRLSYRELNEMMRELVT